jgi:O-antigen/teichoic acid export membrane protein
MKILKNTIITISGSVIPAIIALVTLPIYLRYIGEERYGILAMISVLIGYFSFFDFGLGRAIARRMSQIDSDIQRSELFNTVFVIIVSLAIIGGIVLFNLTSWIMTYVFNLDEKSINEVDLSIKWLPPTLFLMLLNSVMIGTLQAKEKFASINAAVILGDTLVQLLPLFVASIGYIKIEELLLSALTARFVTFVILFFQCIKHVPIINPLSINLKQINPLLIYGSWASAITMIGPLMSVIDRLVIGNLTGSKGVALFAIPYGLITKISLLPNSFGFVLFPKFAGLPTEDSKSLADKAGKILLAIMTPVCIMSIALCDPFIIWWMGHDFAERCAGIAEILTIGVWISCIIMPYSYFLYAEAKFKLKILLFSLFQIPMYLLFLWIGVKYFGVIGGAGAWALRILIDAIFIITLYNSVSIFKNAIISIIILLFLNGLILYFDDFNKWKWLAIAFFIFISSIINYKLYIYLLNLIFKKLKY